MPTAPATTKTTTPRATRPRKAPAKATTAKATPAAPPEAPTTDADRLVVEFDWVEDTKQFAKFQPPAELRDAKIMVGNLYVPHGTSRVLVKISSENGDDV